jgi:hypothetical protein
MFGRGKKAFMIFKLKFKKIVQTKVLTFLGGPGA